MVKIHADHESINFKSDEYIVNNFDLVCALFYDDNEQLLRVNHLCRQNNINFLCGQVFGINGFMFVDLNKYNYIWYVYEMFALLLRKPFYFNLCLLAWQQEYPMMKMIKNKLMIKSLMMKNWNLLKEYVCILCEAMIKFEMFLKSFF